MRKVAAVAAAAVIFAAGAAAVQAGKPSKTPPPPAVEKTRITLTVQDFFDGHGSGQLDIYRPINHEVSVASFDGTEVWKGITNGEGRVRFNLNGPFTATVYCPDGQHASFTQRYFPEDKPDAVEFFAVLKPATGRFLRNDGEPGDMYEPSDNARLGATPLTIGGTVQLHNFGPARGDLDWVRFEALAGKVYMVKIESAQRYADTVLRVYGPEGDQVLQVNDDDETGFASTLAFVAETSGTHYVEVAPFSADTIPPRTGYGISVREFGIDDTDAPSDIADAPLVLLDQPVEAQGLFPRDDVDSFQVVLDSYETYVFETHGLQGGADTVLQLLDASGAVLTSNDDVVNGVNSQVVYNTGPNGGVYFVQVMANGGNANPNFAYNMTVRSHGGLPHADAGPDQKFCVPSPRLINLSASNSGNVIGPYTFTQGSKSLVDISTWTGVQVVAMGDDVFTSLALPFTFTYYGQNKNVVHVASNGFVTFNTAGATTFGNVAIPNGTAPNDALYGFWDDINPLEGGTIYAASGIVDGQNAFVAYWKNVAFFASGGTERADFEVILFQDNTIDFRYGSQSTAGRGTGSSATIGAEDAPGTNGPQIAFGNAGAAVPGRSYTLRMGGAIKQNCTTSGVQQSICGPILAAGTALPKTDDGTTLVNLPFTFTHFGTPRTQVYINANGFLTFNAIGTGFFTNGTIPSTAAPNAAIYGFWDDLYTIGAGSGFYGFRTDGVAPNRIFRVIWQNIPHFATPAANGAVTFQISLFEGSNRIEFCYGPRTGTSAFNGTIGIENNTGTAATQIAFASSGTNFPANGTQYAIGTFSTPALTFEWDVNGDGVFDFFTETIQFLSNPNQGPDCASQRRKDVVTLRVRACGTGATDTDTVVIENGDFEPPTVQPSYDVNQTPAQMYEWPPNHECVQWDVRDLATAQDNCGVQNIGIAETGCDGCYSSQPVLQSGTGSGNFTPDCCVNDGACGNDRLRNTFRIREERDGNQNDYGEDRAYFVRAQALDTCGNTGETLVGVCVIHDMSNADTGVCQIGNHLEAACPGPDNHRNKNCARP